MKAAPDGVWETRLPGTYWGKFYGYRINGPQDKFECFDPAEIIADPYSPAVVSKNTFRQESLTILVQPDTYDWQNDSFVAIPPEDAIIYEMHVRDMTAHASAGVQARGTYRGLLEDGASGGLSHILNLGVNAIELLPCQAFGKFEPPFGQQVSGKTNTWNGYARNHWGYMTTHFFAPEAYYASGGHAKSGEYIGQSGEQVREFKDMVKACHGAGLAVIMDVVYNHVSQYDLNPLKYSDKQYYFRLDRDLDYVDDATGCGNELKSERKMARRLIIDSVLHWMNEYHIDGFRFDLAAALDWQTLEDIRHEARKVNPNVILIAEPWSLQHYDLSGFSERGWAAWNDLFRNGIKGHNPKDGLGFIFGNYNYGNGPDTIQRYLRGSTRAHGGPFERVAHAVNYLAAHDGYTLGDFIRIGTGEVDPHAPVQDLLAHVKLSKQQMEIHKLAATLLLTSLGAVMVHAGQEFARSKIIASTRAPENCIGHLDENSYAKDDETNWLNFEHKQVNRELFDFYRGLIQLRRQHPAFRRTRPESVQMLTCDTHAAQGFHLPKNDSGDSHDFLVLVNANPKETARFYLPDGRWRRVADMSRAGTVPFGRLETGFVEVSKRGLLVLRFDE